MAIVARLYPRLRGPGRQPVTGPWAPGVTIRPQIRTTTTSRRAARAEPMAPRLQITRFEPGFVAVALGERSDSMRRWLAVSSSLVGLIFSSTSWAAADPLPPVPPAPPEYEAPPPPPPPPPGRRSEWGAQLRLETAAMGHDASPDAGMGGIGFSVRPRLS